MKTKKTQLIKITSDFVKENFLAIDYSQSNYSFDLSTLVIKSQNLIKVKLIRFGKFLIKTYVQNNSFITRCKLSHRC